MSEVHYQPTAALRNSAYAGNGFIAGIAPGIVTVDGVAAVAWVYLFDHKHFRIIDFVKSGADGTYRFDNLSTEAERWALLASDLTGEHNMVVRARVTAAVA